MKQILYCLALISLVSTTAIGCNGCNNRTVGTKDTPHDDSDVSSYNTESISEISNNNSNSVSNDDSILLEVEQITNYSESLSNKLKSEVETYDNGLPSGMILVGERSYENGVDTLQIRTFINQNSDASMVYYSFTSDENNDDFYEKLTSFIFITAYEFKNIDDVNYSFTASGAKPYAMFRYMDGISTFWGLNSDGSNSYYDLPDWINDTSSYDEDAFFWLMNCINDYWNNCTEQEELVIGKEKMSISSHD